MGQGGESPRTADVAFRAGVDIGGTFTDIVLAGEDGRIATSKISSTTADYSRAILDGLLELLERLRLPGAAISEIVHGTTVATNAILEYKGARTALLTTRGFRDVLELKRTRVPELYNPRYAPPRPLVERYLRLEVDERMGADGQIIRPLDEATVHAAIERMRAHGVEAVAVCLLHSYRNSAHERRVGEIVRQELPDAFLSLSVDVLPEFREYERTSTAVINAYVGPTVRTYLDSLARRLAEAAIGAPVLLMQSNGGAMSAGAARDIPAHILESGPAAGVIAAQRLSERTSMPDLITFDMGGTTAKAAMIQDGQLKATTDYEIGAGISLSSRLTRGGGHALRLPVLDIAEVGAGGGSIVWIDRGGALKVGPQSSGAVPGPACYGLGDDPTVTDATLVLGYLNPDAIAGGAIRLNAARSRRALREKVARPLGLELLETAYGVTVVAIASMVRAVKAVSTYVGRDPRSFALLAFGGSGPMFAAAMARSLGMRRVVIPPAAGLFSSFGLLEADLEQHFARTFFGLTSEIDLGDLNRAFDGLENQARATLNRHRSGEGDVVCRRALDLHYAGQTMELTIAVPPHALRANDIPEIVELFGKEHERTYGHRPINGPVEFVNLRVAARLEKMRPTLLAGAAVGASGDRSRDGSASGGLRRDARAAYFGPVHGLVRTPVVRRADLARRQLGPLIVDEYDSTTVVPPDCAVELDAERNMLIDVA